MESHGKSSSIDLTLKLGPSNYHVDQSKPNSEEPTSFRANRGFSFGIDTSPYKNDAAIIYPNDAHMGSATFWNRNIINLLLPAPSNTNMYPYPMGNYSMPPSSSSSLRKHRDQNDERHCRACGVKSTPLWRKGPDGPQTLCNACGLRHLRTLKKND